MGGAERRRRRIKRYTEKLLSFTKDDKLEMARWMRSNQTPGEHDVWTWMDRQNRAWTQAVGRGSPRPRWGKQRLKWGFVADFYCPFLKLVVEVDGHHHLKPERMEMDRRKDACFAKHGIKVVRVRWPFSEKPEDFMPRIVQARRDDLA